MLAYRPYKSINGMSTVLNQHVRYYQSERDLCTVLGDLRDLGYHEVLGMDSNDNVRGGSASTALADIGIKEAVINNHQGESVLATCVRNTQRRPIDSI